FLIDVAMGNFKTRPLTRMVMKFQDAWVTLAPTYMESVALVIAAENGLDAEVTWNGRGEPSLLVARGFPSGISAGFGRKQGTVTVSSTEKRTKYTYQPRGGGARVEVPETEIESVTFESGGKKRTAYRKKSAPGRKAGQFVKKEQVELDGGSDGFPEPLAETSTAHRVLVTGSLIRPSAGAFGSWSFPPVQAQAEAGHGEVFGGFVGKPSFEARLIPVAAD
ncbi:MAG: hypothetical protein AAB368_11340, partial [bacterium]